MKIKSVSLHVSFQCVLPGLIFGLFLNHFYINLSQAVFQIETVAEPAFVILL